MAVYMNLVRIPFDEGSWVSRAPRGGFDAASEDFCNDPYKEITHPGGRFISTRNHAARLEACREGAALSAHRSATLIAEKVRSRLA
jgi:hypothetical protein